MAVTACCSARSGRTAMPSNGRYRRILLLLIADLTRAPALFLHLCGLAIVIGRVLHAIGLSLAGGYSFGRLYGQRALVGRRRGARGLESLGVRAAAAGLSG